MRQQPALDVQRTASALVHKAARAGFAYDTMAGNDDGDWIRAARLTHRARAGLQLHGQVAIAARLPTWNGAHRLPHFAAMLSAVEF